MTDLEARRRAMNLAAQLPANPKARRDVLLHMIALTTFMDGNDLPTAGLTVDLPAMIGRQ